jgi:hypothetical protein
MKPLLLVPLFFFFTFFSVSAQDLIITGVIDGPLSGGTPKAIEFVALQDIPDLSRYGVGSAVNGGGSEGVEFTFPAISITKDTFILVSREETGFNTWFGFPPDYVDSVAIINGNDAIEVFFDGNVYDVYGDVNTDGTGQPWEYVDGWAYRKNDTDFSVNFDPNGWTYSGVNALGGEATNGQAATPFPFFTFDVSVLSINPIENKISITPNPVTNGVVSLKGFDAPIAVTLYNLSGQQVLRQTTSEVLDVRSLGRGLYLMRIHHRGQTIARKLVIE